MTDSIRLTVPHARAYNGVVRLVVAGLAARHDMPYDRLEDVQVALESLLANQAYSTGGDVTVELGVDGGALVITIGPLDAGHLDTDLARDPEERDGIGLRRLLTTVTGEFEVQGRDGGDWVRLRKEIRAETEPTP